MNALAGTGLAVASLVVGVVVGRFWIRPRRTESTRPLGPTFAELMHRLVQSSTSGLAVINRYGDVVMHNPRAEELGVVRVARADPRALKACEQVIETGVGQEVDLSPPEHKGREPIAILGHVRSLGDGFAVVDAEDTSDAVRLEATRRDFVANVSHELKTPVGAVGLLAEAVLDCVDDPDEVRHFSTKILNEANRLGSMVTELIALSRLTGAERLPELAVVEVDDVVSEALARSRLVAESTGIRIAVDEPSGLQVDGDRTLLVTALSNLLNNAVAYSPQDAPVSVSRRLVSHEGVSSVEIAVTDRGIGIAPQHQQRVFERFFRVDPARSRATGGTGLGLAIVKHVAANHGGEVRLWSRPGTGSTFTLRLPAAAPERDAGHGSTNGNGSSGHRGADTRGRADRPGGKGASTPDTDGSANPGRARVTEPGGLL